LKDFYVLGYQYPSQCWTNKNGPDYCKIAWFENSVSSYQYSNDGCHL